MVQYGTVGLMSHSTLFGDSSLSQTRDCCKTCISCQVTT